MPMNGMRTEKQLPRLIGFITYLSEIDADMLNGRLSFTMNWGTKTDGDGILLYFGTNNTKRKLYLYDVACARCKVRDKRRKCFIMSENHI